MSAVAPAGVGLADEAEVCFVDEGGGLQGLAGPFAGDSSCGQAAQLVVDDG